MINYFSPIHHHHIPVHHPLFKHDCENACFSTYFLRTPLSPSDHPTIVLVTDHEEPDLLRYTFPAKRGEITGLVVCLALRLCALSLNGGTILLWDFEARAGWMDAEGSTSHRL